MPVEHGRKLDYGCMGFIDKLRFQVEQIRCAVGYQYGFLAFRAPACRVDVYYPDWRHGAKIMFGFIVYNYRIGELQEFKIRSGYRAEIFLLLHIHCLGKMWSHEREIDAESASEIDHSLELVWHESAGQSGFIQRGELRRTLL